jgi:ATP-dependent Clp protease protease subunit
MQKLDISQILSEGIDVVNRRIYFGSIGDKNNDFEWSTVEVAVRAIHALNKVSSEPIELHVSSSGGEELDMGRLYDVIKSCPCHIRFVGGGYIQSAAVWIMAACDERVLYESTEIMIHEGSGGNDPEASHTDQHIMLKSQARKNKYFWKLLSENSHMPISFWERVGSRDLYVTAQEAVNLGLADKIVPQNQKINKRKIKKISNKAKRDLAVKCLQRVGIDIASIEFK